MCSGEALLAAWERYTVDITGMPLPINCMMFDENTNMGCVGYDVDLTSDNSPLVLLSGEVVRQVLLAYDYSDILKRPKLVH